MNNFKVGEEVELIKTRSMGGTVVHGELGDKATYIGNGSFRFENGIVQANSKQNCFGNFEQQVYRVTKDAPFSITKPGSLVKFFKRGCDGEKRYTLVDAIHEHGYTISDKYLEPVEEEVEVGREQVGGSHYQMPIEPIDFIVKNELGYREGNVVKYVCRHKKKNGAEDIRKAIHYLEMILEDYIDG